MRLYTAAIPNKVCQRVIDEIYPQTRFMLSPVSQTSFKNDRLRLLNQKGYAIDNGAYGYHTRGQDFNGGAFLSLCDKYAENADWIVIPDKVGNWTETQKMAMRWINILLSYKKPLMMVAQDGAEENDYQALRSWTSNNIISGGIFVGGTTEWKLNHMSKLVEICQQSNKICHVGRVNSAQRLIQCHDTGVHSVDGSGASRFKPTTMIMTTTMRYLDKQIKLF